MGYSSPGHLLPELPRGNAGESHPPPPATRGEEASPVLCPHPAYFLNPLETLTCLKPAAESLRRCARGGGWNPAEYLRGGGTLIMRTPKTHAMDAAQPAASSGQCLACVSFLRLSGPRSFASARGI